MEEGREGGRRLGPPKVNAFAAASREERKMATSAKSVWPVATD